MLNIEFEKVQNSTPTVLDQIFMLETENPWNQIWWDKGGSEKRGPIGWSIIRSMDIFGGSFLATDSFLDFSVCMMHIFFNTCKDFGTVFTSDLVCREVILINRCKEHRQTKDFSFGLEGYSENTGGIQS